MVLVSEKERSSRSGTSCTYGERMARGYPNKTYSLPQDVVDLIETMAEDRGLSRSRVVEEAIRSYAEDIERSITADRRARRKPSSNQQPATGRRPDRARSSVAPGRQMGNL